MPRRPPQQRLTLFLLKDGVTTDNALRARESLRGYRVDGIGSATEALFVKPSFANPPKWIRLVEPHVEGDLSGLVNSSTSAVLLVEASGRMFAFTFGHGRHLLEPEAMEQDFGLKVVLNTVAFDQIKSVDARTVDELTLHTRRDVSRDSSFEAFGLDVTRDLVRAVTGTPQREGLEGRLTGSDALALSAHIALPDLPALAARLLVAYDEDTYKQHFGFVDHLRTVRDAELIQQLDDALVAALRTRDIANLHLAVPDPLDWVEIAGFKFSTQRGPRDLDPDPRISEYLETRQLDDLLLERLKHDQVEAMSAADEAMKYRGWSVYRSIVFETERGEHLYALSAGQWYRVSLAFKEDVYAFVKALPAVDAALPDADLGTDEAAYLAKAAQVTGALSLDQQLVRNAVPDPVEICDLLTSDGVLLHCKKRGKSSTLSHLFAQGVTSAELLMQDAAFRAEARDIAGRLDASFADVLPRDRPSRDDHEVGYVVITRSRRDSPLTLPFFSLVSLRAAAQRLDALGFRVSASAIEERGSGADAA